MKLTLGYFLSGKNQANILGLKKRCNWRNIELEIMNLESSNNSVLSTDIILIEGPANMTENGMIEKIQTSKSSLKIAYQNNTAILGIGLGYQLIGSYFMTGKGLKIEGTDLINARSVEIKNGRVDKIIARSELFGSIVGGKKNSYKIYHQYKGLATIEKGLGNNGEDGLEGIFHEHLIGTTIEGAFLPRNPKVADYLIKKALDKKYGRPILKELNDIFEKKASENFQK